MSSFLEEFDQAAVKMGSMDATDDVQARNDDGTFASEEPVVDRVEEAVAENTEVIEDLEEITVGESLFAGKYKTADDLATAYKALEAKLGEQSSQIAESRKLADEMAAIREQMGTPAVQTPQYDPDEVSSWFDENPTMIPQVVAEAFQNNDNTLYQIGLQKWHEYSPVQAMEFTLAVREQAMKAEFDAKLAQATLPIQQQAQKAAADNAVARVSAEFPEMKTDEFARVMQEEAQNAPWLATVVATGDPAQLEQALRSLALMAKGRLADTLLASAQKDRGTQQQANHELKKEAAVLSATSSPTREPVTGQSQWLTDFENSREFKKAAGLM